MSEVEDPQNSQSECVDPLMLAKADAERSLPTRKDRESGGGSLCEAHMDFQRGKHG